MSISIDEFLKRIQKITDKDFREALGGVFGKNSPFIEPEKFKNMRKQHGDIKLTPILLKAFELYFLYTATQPSVRMYKGHVKQTLKDLELRMKYLPKAIDNLALFKEAGVTKKDICMLACREYPYQHSYGEKDSKVASTVKKNCNTCSTKYSNK